jgi:hypothetical protein
MTRDCAWSTVEKVLRGSQSVEDKEGCDVIDVFDLICQNYDTIASANAGANRIRAGYSQRMVFWRSGAYFFVL